MTAAEKAIENALTLVAQSRSLRERAQERRRELQKKTEVITTRPLYILKKNGGRKLSLRLDA